MSEINMLRILSFNYFSGDICIRINNSVRFLVVVYFGDMYSFQCRFQKAPTMISLNVQNNNFELQMFALDII